MYKLYTLAYFISSSFILVFGVMLIISPITGLLPLLSDDAFYYQVIARNIAQGVGITFDGLSRTNGFHPLYLAVLVPIHLVLQDNLNLILRVTLFIDLLFFVAASFLILKFVEKLNGSRAGLVAGLAFLFNPWALTIIINGVESAIYIFFLILTFLVYTKFRETLTWPTIFHNRTIYLFVFLCALTILARTEAIIFVPCVAIDLFTHLNIRAGREGIQSQIKHYASAFIVVVGGLLLLLLPWTLWNLRNFDTLMQSSGSTLFYHTHQNIPINDLRYWLQGAVSAKTILIRATLFSFQLISLFIPLLILMVLLPKKYRQERIRGKAHKLSPLFVISIYNIGILFFYAFILRRNQVWYFSSLVVFSAILFAVLGNWFIQRNEFHNKPKNKSSFIFLWIFLLFTFGCGVFYWQIFGYSRSDSMLDGYKIAAWFKKTTPGSVRIATWSSGVIGFYSERTVINLDGMVNNEILPYLKARNGFLYDMDTMMDYIQSKNIDYITDIDVLPLTFISLDLELGFEVVATFPSSVDPNNNLNIYRIR